MKTQEIGLMFRQQYLWPGGKVVSKERLLVPCYNRHKEGGWKIDLDYKECWPTLLQNSKCVLDITWGYSKGESIGIERHGDGSSFNQRVNLGNMKIWSIYDKTNLFLGMFLFKI